LPCAAEASFFLGRFGPFAAMPKGLGPRANERTKGNPKPFYCINPLSLP
jgi:hypothetical protein